MIKEGFWRVESKIDSRWTNEGTCYGSVFYVPDMNKWIEKCKQELGEIPDDCTMAFMKF